jgi:transcriptional regulator with XRE-family HTH domain
VAHLKTPEERGAIGAWAYETRDRLGLSVEQVVERLPTRYHPATLRKIEGGSAKAGRRMLRELAELYLAEGKARGIAVIGPPGSRQDESGDDVAAAIRDQTKAIETQTAVMRDLLVALTVLATPARDGDEAALDWARRSEQLRQLLGRQAPGAQPEPDADPTTPRAAARPRTLRP